MVEIAFAANASCAGPTCFPDKFEWKSTRYQGSCRRSTNRRATSPRAGAPRAARSASPPKSPSPCLRVGGPTRGDEHGTTVLGHPHVALGRREHYEVVRWDAEFRAHLPDDRAVLPADRVDVDDTASWRESGIEPHRLHVVRDYPDRRAARRKAVSVSATTGSAAPDGATSGSR
jgi:hypothetical protein